MTENELEALEGRAVVAYVVVLCIVLAALLVAVVVFQS